MILEAAGVPRNELHKQPQGAPSSGFVSVMAMLQICDELDVYGFGMCDSTVDTLPKRCDFVKVNTNNTTLFHGPISRQAIELEQEKTKYFCSYYPVTAKRLAQDQESRKGPSYHYFAAEHALIQRLSECGLLNKRDGH